MNIWDWANWTIAILIVVLLVWAVISRKCCDLQEKEVKKSMAVRIIDLEHDKNNL